MNNARPPLDTTTEQEFATPANSLESTAEISSEIKRISDKLDQMLTRVNDFLER